MKYWRSSEVFARQQRMGGETYPADAEDAAIDGVSVWSVGGNHRAQTPEPAKPSQSAEPDSSIGREKQLVRKLDHWIASMERLGLADYVRYVDNRKRIFWSNFLGGLARGVGTAVGFTILGAILVMILQNLAKHNLPLIGDMLAEIVTIVQMRLQ